MERAKLDAELKALRRRLERQRDARPDPLLSEADAWHIAVRWLISAERNAAEAGPIEITEERTAEFAYLCDASDTNTLSYVRGKAQLLLEEEDLQVADGSPQEARLVRYLHEAMIEAEKRILLRSGYTPLTLDPQFSKIDAASKVHPGANITLRALIERYRADLSKAPRSPKTRLKQQAQDRVLMEIVGAETLVRQITREDVRRAQEIISKLPPNWTKKFPGLVVTEVPVMEGGQRLSATTANSYIAFLTGLITYAYDEGIIDKNIGGGLRIAQPLRSEKPRLPFTSGELSTIFRAPLYTGCVDDERGFAIPGDNRPRRSRFWVPLIALFTGMRLNEICQLTEDDIALADGVDIIHVRISDNDKEDEERKRVKTAAGIRFVPIHPELKKIGLMQLVARARSQGRKARLFPELLRGSTGYLSDPFSKRYAYFLDKVGITDRTKTFHSFRHTYRDALEEADIGLSRVRALGGWSKRGTEDHYGVGLSARSLAAAIEQVRFDGLDLSHLYARDL